MPKKRASRQKEASDSASDGTLPAHLHWLPPLITVAETLATGEDVVDLASWPVHSTDAQDALDEMVSDTEHPWEPVPIPAYNVDGEAIDPQDYETKLEGAVLLLTLNFTHQYYRPWQEDNYYADIEEIWVLKQPFTLASPTKRKLTEKSEPSPKKARSSVYFPMFDSGFPCATKDP